jgi:hypothetical protein
LSGNRNGSPWAFSNKAGIHIRSSEAYSDEKGSLLQGGHGVNATGAIGDWDSVCYQSYNGPDLDFNEYRQAGWRVKLTEFQKFSESSTMFTIVCAFQQYEGDHFFVFLPPGRNLDEIDEDLEKSGEVATSLGDIGRTLASLIGGLVRSIADSSSSSSSSSSKRQRTGWIEWSFINGYQISA